MLISEKICRLCLSDVGGYLVPLFNHFKNTDLCSQIFHLTGVQISEDANLPSNICKLCYNQLENFEKFKNQVQKTDCILRQQIDTSEKIEASSNLNSELQPTSGDYTFQSANYTNKKRINVAAPTDIIDLHSFRVDKVLTTLSAHKTDTDNNTDGNIIPMDMTNTNVQKTLSNILDEKDKEESTGLVTLYTLDGNKSSSNINNSLVDSQDKTDYTTVQKNIISSSDDSSECTGDAVICTKNEGKLTLQCEICHKIFKTKTTLRRHSVVHTGHEYHKCVECHKVFAHKHNLVKHFRIHSGITLTCTVCQKMFTQPEYLKNHMINTHSEGGSFVLRHLR